MNFARAEKPAEAKSERASAPTVLPEFLKPRPNATAPFRLGVILVPGFALMSFASLIEPVRGANRLSGASLYDWQLFAPEGGMVESNSGITVAASPVSILEQSQFDLVVVCAASHAEQRRFRTVEDLLRRLARNNVALAAVSTGSFLLARAGLL